MGPQEIMMGDRSGRIRGRHGSQIIRENVTQMDKYIIERRARVRLAWFKRYEEIGNVSQIRREFGISHKTL